MSKACRFLSDSDASAGQWKGRATYWNVQVDSSAPTIPARVWSYEKPTSAFKPIAGYLSFYASAGTKSGQGDWTCFVNDEVVQAQDGDVSDSLGL